MPIDQSQTKEFWELVLAGASEAEAHEQILQSNLN